MFISKKVYEFNIRLHCVKANLAQQKLCVWTGYFDNQGLKVNHQLTTLNVQLLQHIFSLYNDSNYYISFEVMQVVNGKQLISIFSYFSHITSFFPDRLFPDVFQVF